MYLEKFVTKRYSTYSIFEKIDLLITLHRAFNLMLDATRKIREIKDLDIFEEEVFNLELLNLKEDVWRCENGINHICEKTTNSYILEKVEAAQIDPMPHKITEHNPMHYSLEQSIKRLLLLINLYSLQIKELDKRKSIPEISDYEKNILTKIIESLELKIIDNYHDIHYKVRWEVSSVFRLRREIIDEIEDSEIEASKVLSSERNCVTVDYLKDEENGNIDLRKWKIKKWITKRYDMFKSQKYQFLDYRYTFNFQALRNGFNRYSFEKQIEVGLAYYKSIKIQLEALMEWRKNRQNKLTEYEELIYNYKTTMYQTSLDTWDYIILKVFFVDINSQHFYSPEKIERIWDKIQATELKVNSYNTDKINSYNIVDSEQFILKREICAEDSYKDVLINYGKFKILYNDKYKKLSLSFAPGRMSGNAYISPSDPYDPNRAEFIKFLIAKHIIQTAESDALLESIGKLKEYEKRYEQIIIKSLCVYKTHHILLTDEKIWDSYNMLPDDYPDRGKVHKEIKKAKICLGSEQIKKEKNLEEIKKTKVCRDLDAVKKEKKQDKELYDYRAYPGSKELFANDEPPKPADYFQGKKSESCDKSPSDS
jgi:hypothetical protein